MRRLSWAQARALAGAALLGVVVWWVGTGPFLDGVRSVDGWSLAAAAGIAAVTTVCSAWRWTVVAGGLGLRLPLPAAVAAYYRSQFLNTVLPGGVLGDVDRGVRHGRHAGDVGRALRAVVLERSAGQLLQAAVVLVVLLVLPSPVRSTMPTVYAALAAVLVVLLLAAAVAARLRRRLRVVAVASRDIRRGLLDRRRWPLIVVASAVVVAGHTATFLIAARTVGAASPLLALLPLALLVLLAMGLPTNVGGWGPREGVSAWVFALAGLDAEQGVAAAVVYGVMVLVASAPGALLLVAARWHHGPRRHQPAAATAPAAVGAVVAGAPRRR